MPPILDVAIGTAFIFLLFSIVVTALNEIWLSLLDKRAAFLKDGLKELLLDGGDVTPTAILHHGLIASLSKGKYEELPEGKEPNFVQQILIGFLPRRLCQKLGWTLGTRGVPSYIPGKSFVLALLSLVKKDAAAPPAPIANAPAAQAPVAVAPPAAALEPLEAAQASKATAEATLARLAASAATNAANAAVATATAARQASEELRDALGHLPEGKLRSSLLALYADAAGDMEHFKGNIENWFNESMDRVGGWYKRYAQQWLFFLALLLAVACNVDSIHIIRALSTDRELRASVVAQAEKYADTHNTSATANRSLAVERSGGSVTVNVNAVAGAGAAVTPEPDKDSESPAQKIQRFNEALAVLGGTGIPMGWDDPAINARLFSKHAAPGAWISALAGWILTALAASLGAPFWFDTLNRFVDLRGVGRAPEEKDITSPKKKSTGVESFVETGDSKK